MEEEDGFDDDGFDDAYWAQQAKGFGTAASMLPGADALGLGGSSGAVGGKRGKGKR